MNLRKNAGITLIALIITIIILLILAAVSVVALRDTNLFERTQRATQVYNESRLDEEDKLAGYKYAIDEHDANVPTINKLKGASYLTLSVDVGEHISGTVTASKSNGGNLDLSTYRIMMASGNSSFIPTESDWEEKTSIEVTEPNTMVYAVLYDGTKYGANASKLITLEDIDGEKPKATIANLTLTNSSLGISTTITSKDEESGLNYEQCKWIFTTSQSELGLDISKYTEGSISGETTSITKAKTPGTYYLHVLLTDNKGNQSETISSNSVTTAVKNFGYNGGVQSATLVPGQYKLEVWGAAGGGANHSYNYANGAGGGYSYGNFSVNQNTTVYACVGGQGTKSATSDNGNYAGGYNGGGTGQGAGGGGGATHIGLKSAVLTSFASDYQTQLLLVAGGGGGANAVGGNQNQALGGPGGGTSGIAGATTSNWGYQSYTSSPGTQTAVGSNSTGWNGGNGGFGRGRDYYSSYTGGGGGGFYGGANGTYHGGSGAGGSGYVNTSKLTNANTIAGNTSFTAPGGGTEVGHIGHGYAKITPIG